MVRGKPNLLEQKSKESESGARQYHAKARRQGSSPYFRKCLQCDMPMDPNIALDCDRAMIFHNGMTKEKTLLWDDSTLAGQTAWELVVNL
eukprot:scaffold172_cov341-Pavlova_lutheri.AAC.14